MMSSNTVSVANRTRRIAFLFAALMCSANIAVAQASLGP